MDFKVIYKLDITIVEEKSSDGNSPQEIKGIKNNRPNGDTCIVKGSITKVKADICKQIDKLSEDLNKWYYGEED